MKSALYIFILSFLSITYTHAQLWADVETGAVLGTPYNKISIPNARGTRFDLGKEFAIKPIAYYRLRLGYTFKDRHTITALYAPLTATYDGQFDRNVRFNDVLFGANQPTKAEYQFNSYRLTYRYGLVRGERFRLGVGFTAKIRDADIRLISGGQDTHFSNVGFVPLLNLLLEFRPSDRWRVLLEADALAGGPGRAEDVFLGLGYKLTPRIGLRAGYRVVEGGADVESVYNFTWINYAAVGATVMF